MVAITQRPSDADRVQIRRKGPYANETMAALAAAIPTDAPQRFALAGLSLGGIVTIKVLRQATDRFERLALLDTNPLAEAPEIRARRQVQIDRALSGDLIGVMRAETKLNYIADPSDTALLDLCLDMAVALGPEVLRRQSLALRDRPDQKATLTAFKVRRWSP
jgi:pimeloyl-ACP methyl ester carboxylesterase